MAAARIVRRSVVVPRLSGAAFAAAVLAVVAYAAGFASPYELRVLALAGVTALAAVGFQVLWGLAGSLFLGFGVFYGAGAYAAALVALLFGAPFPLTLASGASAALAVAVLLAPAVARLEGHYAALAGVAAAQIASLIATSADAVTGGANGLTGLPPLPVPAAAVAWALAAIAATLAARLPRTQLGASFAVLRETPPAAPVLGLNPWRLRAAALALGAIPAGLAGALAAPIQHVVSPEVFGLPWMITILTTCVLAGQGRLRATLAAALLLTLLPEALRGFGQGYLLVYGVLLLIAVMARREAQHTEVQKNSPLPRLSLENGGRVRGTCDNTKWALHLDSVSKHFGGVAAVDDVSLTVAPGEVVALIGPNGSGKSTLLNLIGGLERPDRGEIRLGETALNRLPPHRIARLGVGRTFQTPLLPDFASVAWAAASGGLAGRTADLKSVVELTGLSEVADRPCGLSSGALRRRVELARALMAGPELLLLDEPSTGVAAADQPDLAALIRGLAAQGLGVLIADHSQAFVESCADRVIRMA